MVCHEDITDGDEKAEMPGTGLPAHKSCYDKKFVST